MEDEKPFDARVQKAQILVLLLGAEFTGASDHPFLREVSQTASLAGAIDKPGDMTVPSGLVEMLQLTPEAPKRSSDQSHINPAEPEPRTAGFKANEDLAQQHPAVIAQQLKARSADDQRGFLKTLPRDVARQVMFHSLRLKSV